MVSEYSSKTISVGVVNLLSGLGLALREFMDQQSWFTVVPACFIVAIVLIVLLFKVRVRPYKCRCYMKLSISVISFVAPIGPSVTWACESLLEVNGHSSLTNF